VRVAELLVTLDVPVADTTQRYRRPLSAVVSEDSESVWLFAPEIFENVEPASVDSCH
jgi:hypothetical protein